jgi:hypothetical protein
VRPPLKTVEVFNEHGEAQQLKLFRSLVEPSAPTIRGHARRQIDSRSACR